MKISKLIYIGTLIKRLYKVNAVNRFHDFYPEKTKYNSFTCILINKFFEINNIYLNKIDTLNSIK